MENKKYAFSAFLAASFLGQFAEGIYNLVCIILLTQFGGTYLAIGYMFVLVMLPSVFVQPFTGELIDKMNKAKLSSIITCLRFLSIAIIPVFWALGYKNVYVVYVSIIISYILYHFLSTTNDSMMEELTGKNSKLSRGIAIAQGALQLGLLSSSIIAGWMMQKLNVYVPLIITMVLYLISTILFFSIRGRFIKKAFIPMDGAKNYVSDINYVVKWLLRNKRILALTTVVALPLPFFGSINTLLSPANITLFHGNSITLGVIDSFAGVGSILATILAVLIHKISKNSRNAIVLSVLLLSISIFSFPHVGGVILATIAYTIIGMLIGMVKIYSRTLVYDLVPKENIGKVFSLWNSVSLLIASAMSWSMGKMATLSVTSAYSVLALLLFIFAVSFLLTTDMHVRDRIAKKEG